jgi:hypothetical protein
MYVFDVQGTLVNNPTVSDEDVKKMLLVLRAAGHHLVLMTGDMDGVPHHLRTLVDECRLKPLRFTDFDKDTVVFDDDAYLLKAAAKTGAKVVAAQQMGAWLASQDWDNGSRRQDA